mmetsp:Transcript_10552/g.30231  ORF Transcript_10552/g.30231 Transcript_10552/m.30231 type:complete len:203 (-) Transcript_10552:488-1096(-)
MRVGAAAIRHRLQAVNRIWSGVGGAFRRQGERPTQVPGHMFNGVSPNRYTRPDSMLGAPCRGIPRLDLVHVLGLPEQRPLRQQPGPCCRRGSVQEGASVPWLLHHLLLLPLPAPATPPDAGRVLLLLPQKHVVRRQRQSSPLGQLGRRRRSTGTARRGRGRQHLHLVVFDLNLIILHHHRVRGTATLLRTPLVQWRRPRRAR